MRLILAALLAAMPTLALAAQSPLVTVRVIDGDTVERPDGRMPRDKVSIRLIGFDAPEMRGRCSQETELAQRATARMRELAAPGLRLNYRYTQGRTFALDQYGRRLAVARTRDGRDVAELLISDGFARPFDGRGARPDWCALLGAGSGAAAR